MNAPVDYVAPRAGAWIEIISDSVKAYRYCVAPRAGAWIEILANNLAALVSSVAPRAGAWIEIIACITSYFSISGRSPCGSVD